ncbi:hypothetical protein KXD40_009431 [Peronospora effusa]|nr:hypothetical protein KXD40_009431 [Peronospora effusa]
MQTKRLAENLCVDKCNNMYTPANESEKKKLIKLDEEDLFTALCAAMEESVWLRLLLADICHASKHAAIIYRDN